MSLIQGLILTVFCIQDNDLFLLDNLSFKSVADLEKSLFS